MIKVFESQSSDPFTNLALEHELLEQVGDEETYLFFYRNDPCIVLGRFQCPWREVNFSRLPCHVKIVRRHSGGGTVYHDRNNLNFCFIRKGTTLHEKENLTLIKDIFSKFNIDLHINDRNDLLCKDREGALKKVSGSAFRRTKNKCYHHGTLLIDANLSDLRGCLGQDKRLTLEGKGVLSHPSPVMNIKEVKSDLSCEDVVTKAGEVLSTKVLQVDESNLSASHRERKHEFASWSWIWAQGPKMKISFNIPELSHIELEIHKGVMTVINELMKDKVELIDLFNGHRVKDDIISCHHLGLDTKVNNFIKVNFFI